MEHARPKAPLGTFFGCLLILFLVLFPKGGSRVGGLPLTWGYLLLVALTPVTLAVRLLALPLRLPRRIVVVTFFLMPMQLLFVYAGEYYGVSNPPFAFSTFVALFALPWIFLLVFAPFFPMLDGERLARWFRNCVFLAAAWGILLFFERPITGHFIEIPYLTVNASDYGDLENTKNIVRGIFFKLISTYNNGNIYGVATLILLPLYLQMEPSRWRRLTVRAAILLTLSRTVWVGLVLNEVLSLLLHLVGQVRTFPVLFLGAARKRFITVMITATCAVFAVIMSNINTGLVQFFFDPTAGNRIGEVYAASRTSFLPEQALYGFAEVVYASAAQYWGWAGLVAFTLIMVSPLIVAAWDPRVMRSPIQRAALKGLVIYMIIAVSDGALDYIPVMAFYWFVYTVFMVGWPGVSQPGTGDVSPAPEVAVPGGLIESPAGS